MERTPFEADLRALEHGIARMAELVTARVETAVGALAAGQAAGAREVTGADGSVNEQQIAIEHLALKLLALQQPAARDLRLITTAIKVSGDLERIGDQAVNLAETCLRLLEFEAPAELSELQATAAVAVEMTRDAVRAFLERDVPLARTVLVRDDEVDYRRDQMFRSQVAVMLADRRAIERAIGLILMSRNLERIADHATNIAEDAIFLAEAKDVRHRHDTP